MSYTTLSDIDIKTKMAWAYYPSILKFLRFCPINSVKPPIESLPVMGSEAVTEAKQSASSLHLRSNFCQPAPM